MSVTLDQVKAALGIVGNYQDNNEYPWCDFGSIVALTDDDTSISSIEKQRSCSKYYTLEGYQTVSLQKRILIVKTGEGLVKKVIVNKK